MNKDLLVKAVAEATEKTQKEVREVVDATFEVIANAMAEGETVSISKFGKFEPALRPERETINPQDPKGAKILVPEKHVPKFKASSVLKNLVA